MLAFTNKEMAMFMAEVKQKKDPKKDDKMFGFGFDDSKRIYQTNMELSRKVQSENTQNLK